MPETDLTHLQIGSGKLALGLIIPVLHEVGLTTTIANRPPRDDSQSSTRCEQLKNDKCYSLDIGKTKKTINFSEFIYLTEKVPESIIKSPNLLITTAVTSEGLDSITEYLANILNSRIEYSNKSLTYIIACENMHDNSDILKGKLRQHALTNKNRRLRQSLNTNCAFLNTIVDRICSFPDPYPSKQATVRTEQDFQWYVDVTSISQHEPWIQILKEKFEPHWNITTNPYFEFYEKRKTWFVNGGHLILAAYTYKFEDKHLNRALMKKEISGKLDSAFKAFSYALDYYKESTLGITESSGMNLLDNLEFGKRVKERFSQSEDTVSRIIASLMKADLATNELYKILKELNTANPDLIELKRGLNNLINTLEINQFTERVESRIIEAIDMLLEYNYISDNEPFKTDPDMAAEVIQICNECLRLINSEAGRTARSIRQALQ